MSVFRVEKNKGYTVMSNHHLRNHALSLKAKGLVKHPSTAMKAIRVCTSSRRWRCGRLTDSASRSWPTL